MLNEHCSFYQIQCMNCVMDRVGVSVLVSVEVYRHLHSKTVCPNAQVLVTIKLASLLHKNL